MDKKQEEIEALKKERKKTLEMNDNTRREILLKKEKTGELGIDVSHRLTKCQELDIEVNNLAKQVDKLKPEIEEL